MEIYQPNQELNINEVLTKINVAKQGIQSMGRFEGDELSSLDAIAEQLESGQVTPAQANEAVDSFLASRQDDLSPGTL